MLKGNKHLIYQNIQVIKFKEKTIFTFYLNK